jgi:hypothetical protein
LKCAAGHPFPNNVRFDSRGSRRCDHWIDAEKRQCGLWIYLIAVEGGGVVVADVTVDELNEIQHLKSGTEIIDFLGIWTDEND